MNKFLKMLPSILLRLSHVIVHLFCNIDSCNASKEDDSE